MENIYEDGTYLKNNPSWDEEDSLWKAKQIKRIIDENHISPATICEIGCGAGEILNQLSSQLGEGKEYFGYEISPQAFALCSKKTKDNLRFFLEDLLKQDDKYFDIVMAIDVLEHVDDYVGFLRKLKARGKYKIFYIPLDLSVQTILRSTPIAYVRRKAGHLHYFTKETALATLGYAGYEVIDFFYTAGGVELPNRGWKANLLKIPTRLMFSLNSDLTVRVLGGFSLMVLAK